MSNNSGLMRIVEYNSTADITVLFVDDETTKKTTYKHFQEGKVESDYMRNQREKEIQYRKELIEKQRQENLEKRDKTGESIILDNGMVATITRFNNQNDMDVSISGEIISGITYPSFKNGMKDWVKEYDREHMVGNVVENKYNTQAIITGFNEKDLTFDLKLDNGYKFNKKCLEVEDGIFTTPYDKTVGGVGYLGEKYTRESNRKLYQMWYGMLDRVYLRQYLVKNYTTYKDCFVCDRWFNFSNFCDDVLSMWYDCDEQLDLDKDIKYKGNKEYAPDKCLLVPHNVNILFANWRESEDEAGEYYRKIKYEYVRKVLKSYEGRIPDYVMNYCLRFEFEVDDGLVGGSDGCSDVGDVKDVGE